MVDNLRNKISVIDPVLKDVWPVTKVTRIALGLNLGIFQYTYHVFLYDHFGSNSLALQRVVFLMVITNLIILLCDVPTGAIGDYLGRKKTVIFCFVLGTIACLFRTSIFFIDSISISFIVATLAAVIYGLSYSLFSGNFTAWLVDTVRERNATGGYAPIIARSYTFMIIAKVVGAAVSLSLYLYGYVFYAFGLGCISYLLCTFYCTVAMKETESLHFHEGRVLLQQTVRRMREIILEGYKIASCNKPVAYLVIMFAAFFVLTYVVLHLWPIAMKAVFGMGKMSPFWFVIVFACFVTSFVGAKALEILSRNYIKTKNTKVPGKILWSWYVIVALITALPIFVLGYCTYTHTVTLPLFILAVALSNVGYGFFMPAHETLINYYIPDDHSKERATVMSFSTMLVQLVIIILMFPSSGTSGEATAVGWTLPAAILVVTTIVINILMRRYERQKDAASAKLAVAPVSSVEVRA